MSTVSAPSPGTSRLAVTFPRLLRSELIKLVTVRSTIWALSISVVFVLAFATIAALVSRGEDIFDGDASAGAMAPIVGVYLAQLFYIVLGVIGIGAEYSTGMIRSTLSAAPTRVPALLAKTGVLGVATFMVALASVLVAFVLVQAILSSTTFGVSIGDPEVARMLVGSALYLAFVTMLALSVGAIVRNTAAGISIMVTLLVVMPAFFPAIPWAPLDEILKYLPGAGESVMAFPGQVAHSTWVGFAILAAWTVGAGVVAAVLIKRRDA